jgi:hypothetical protein
MGQPYRMRSVIASARPSLWAKRSNQKSCLSLPSDLIRVSLSPLAKTESWTLSTLLAEQLQEELFTKALAFFG